MSASLQVKDRVRLRLPDNSTLDGADAVVEALQPWGAHVSCRAAAFGTFRALWEEMELLEGGRDCQPAVKEAVTVEREEDTPEIVAHFNGKSSVKPVSTAFRSGTSVRKPVSRGRGVRTPATPTMSATGEMCSTCGGLNLVRTGACLTCQDCGTNSGCS